MSEREVRTVPMSLEVRQEGDESPKIVGHAAVFNKNSEPIMGFFVERIRPGAFQRAIDDEQDVRALINHDADKLLGRIKSGTLSLAEDKRGLKIEIDPPDTSYARDVLTSIRRGDMDSMSFAFSVVKEEWTREKGPNKLDVRELIDVDLFDVSPVTFPAYPQTDVAVRSHKQWRSELEGDERDWEREMQLQERLDNRPAEITL